MLTYLNNEIFGFILNLVTVMCFAGLHEVSRELENPFQNAPNDLPANNFHAQFNEALMSMFAGYHPDAYWEVKETVVEESNVDSAASLPDIDSANSNSLPNVDSAASLPLIQTGGHGDNNSDGGNSFGSDGHAVAPNGENGTIEDKIEATG